MDITGCKVHIAEIVYHYKHPILFIVKAQVYVKGCEYPFEDLGSGSGIEEAATMAIGRAAETVGRFLGLDLVDHLLDGYSEESKKDESGVYQYTVTALNESGEKLTPSENTPAVAVVKKPEPAVEMDPVHGAQESFSPPNLDDITAGYSSRSIDGVSVDEVGNPLQEFKTPDLSKTCDYCNNMGIVEVLGKIGGQPCPFCFPIPEPIPEPLSVLLPSTQAGLVSLLNDRLFKAAEKLGFDRDDVDNSGDPKIASLELRLARDLILELGDSKGLTAEIIDIGLQNGVSVLSYDQCLEAFDEMSINPGTLDADKEHQKRRGMLLGAETLKALRENWAAVWQGSQDEYSHGPIKRARDQYSFWQRVTLWQLKEECKTAILSKPVTYTKWVNDPNFYSPEPPQHKICDEKTCTQVMIFGPTPRSPDTGAPLNWPPMPCVLRGKPDLGVKRYLYNEVTGFFELLTTYPAITKEETAGLAIYEGYTPHFGTCTKPSHFRKKKT